MLNFSAKVLTQDLGAAILKAIKPEVQKYFVSSVPAIRKQLQDLIRGSIENTPEYQSLLGGQLQGELGVPNPQSALESIVQALLDSIQVVVTPVQYTGGQLTAGISIGVLSSSLAEVFVPASAYRTEKGETIPWLEWLLTLGDTIIIRTYKVKIGEAKNSRTGLATMVESTKGWKVPAQFSGSIDDNFLTRSLEDLDKYIEDIIVKEMRL